MSQTLLQQRPEPGEFHATTVSAGDLPRRFFEFIAAGTLQAARDILSSREGKKGISPEEDRDLADVIKKAQPEIQAQLAKELERLPDITGPNVMVGFHLEEVHTLAHRILLNAGKLSKSR